MSIVIDDKKITDINISNKNVQKIVDILTDKIIFEKTKPVSNEYFYIENAYNGSNTIILRTITGSSSTTGSHATQLQYSKDKKTWKTITLSGTNSIHMNSGERVYFRNDSGSFNWYNSSNSEDSFYTQIKCSNNHKVGGNINSLLDYNNYNVAITPYCFYRLFYKNEYLTDANELIFSKTSLASGCYSNMFYDCTALTSAPKLPNTTLASNCYDSMFWGCTSLTTAPSLPNTTLATNCYNRMFYGCTSLTTAPSLPATTLVEGCYQNMLSGCTSLTTAPKLPSTTLANYCYSGMFSGCTSLTTAPSLPATTLAEFCYLSMFSSCSSLTSAPILPATTLANNCYRLMFRNCTSLTTAPALPATTLADNCYGEMFWNCSKLTVAPALPATTLASNCCQRMFRECTSLVNVPSLPATTLANDCYREMFYGCTSITTSPVLPATTLVRDCYEYMFYNCSSLNNVTSYANDIGSGTEYTSIWLGNVAATGTFHNLGSATYPRNASGIPTGWTEVKN